jgi:prepilin-type N-terminal cleavage/methylation domain-containing protein
MGKKGYTLIELMVVFMILGLLASVTAVILIALLSSFELSQNKNSVAFIAQRVLTKLTDHLRQATFSPDSLRPWVSIDGRILKFFLNENYADSIRYYFASSGSDTFLYRSYQGGSGELIPDFSEKMVNYLKGSFSVDSAATGYSTTGRVNLNLNVGRRYGSEPDSQSFSIQIYLRNYQ